MTPIILQTIYTKTAKGILEVRNKAVRLPRELSPVFLLIDGKASVADLLPQSGLTTPQLHQALNTLVTDGYIKVVVSSLEQPAADAAPPGEVEFRPTQALSTLNMEIASHMLAETEATKQAQQESRTALDARLRAEAEARARALAEMRVQSEAAQIHAKSEEQAHARAAAEARAREALEAQIATLASVSAQDDKGSAPESGIARAELNPREQVPGVREDARAVALVQDVQQEAPLADLHFEDLAQKLTAKVHAERRARDLAGRESRGGSSISADAPTRSAGPDDTLPSLQLVLEPAAPAAAAKDAVSARAPDHALSPTIAPEPAHAEDVKHTTPEHVPSALERAMTQTAARAEQAGAEKKHKAAEERAAKTAPQVRVAPTLSAAAATPAAADEKVAPTLNEDEPLHERLNVDRTAHDLLAETADVRRKTEAVELGRSAVAARRQRQEEDDRRTAGALRHRRQRRATRAFGLALVGVPALIVAGLQFVPMNGYLPDAQKALSERLNQPVTISTLRYVLLPSPRLVLEGVRVGSAQGIRVDRVDAHAWPMTIAAEPKVFSEVEATGVSIDPGMLGAIPSWTGGRSATAVHVSRLKLKDVKLSMPESEIAGLNGAVTFAANGTVQQAVLANDKVKIEITPQQSGVRVLLNAHDWRPPFGPPVAFSHLTVDGIADRQQFGTTELSARIGGGSLTGTLAARWEGPMTVGGEFKLQGAKIDEVVPLVVPDFRMKGTLGASGRYAMQADSATGVPGKPLVEASFTITRGELPSFDIARAIQSGNAGRGGRTPFDELKGTVHVNAGQYRYRNLQLSSGPLSARGNVDIASGGQISGHIEAAMEARGSTVARSAFSLAGTAKDAQLVR